MHSSFRVKILTPETPVFEGEAKEVTARTQAGKIGILARHTPFLGVLVEGILTVKQGDSVEDDKKWKVSGGMVEVRRNGQVVVLADTAESLL